MGAEFYLWAKAFHIISFTAWMAGMFYLPRLFVYHVDALPGGELAKTLEVMERRLLRAIINPAMILTFIFGLWLMFIVEAWEYGWFHAKVTLVVLLAALHGFLSRWRKQLANGTNTKSAKFYRMMNEVPTVALIVIVLLAIIKPF